MSCARELEHHVAGVVSARGQRARSELASRSESAESIRHDMTVLPRSPLVEEVLDNLLSNACACGVERDVRHNGRCGILALVVTDDGPNGSPLRRFTAVATRSSARTNQRSISDWGSMCRASCAVSTGVKIAPDERGDGGARVIRDLRCAARVGKRLLRAEDIAGEGSNS